jgi:hypothetical protein
MLAGWLFADLFLVLFIVAFSSQPAAPTPTHKPTPAASRKPVKSHPPPQIGLDQNPVNITVDVSPADLDDPATHAQAVAAILASLDKQLAGKELLTDKSGFVLVFATSATDDGSQITEAVQIASSVIPILKSQDAAMFGKTSGEGLWDGPGDFFYFQIFFFTQ